MIDRTVDVTRTPAALSHLKKLGQPIVMVTAYDYNSAVAAEAAGVDIVLVGDSAAMTMLGYASTRLVTLDEMLMLTRAVRRGLARTLLVGDLPFGTYESSDDLALTTALRFVDAGCDAVKLEGGAPDRVSRVRVLTNAGIPVMGHVGLTPQSTGVGEAYHVQGRTAVQALQVLSEANALESAGCFVLVFEAIPAQVTALLAPRVGVPIIGIGAGPATDGQVLVFDDLVGLSGGRPAKFVKRYADVRSEFSAAIAAYADDVRARRFPAPTNAYVIDPTELDALKSALRQSGPP
jgi:3-methyl-2-oxobutanoate hydroxymethyltransferase